MSENFQRETDMIKVCQYRFDITCNLKNYHKCSTHIFLPKLYNLHFHLGDMTEILSH